MRVLNGDYHVPFYVSDGLTNPLDDVCAGQHIVPRHCPEIFPNRNLKILVIMDGHDHRKGLYMRICAICLSVRH